MGEMDERSALVALTEAQIRSLLILTQRWLRDASPNAPTRPTVEKAKDQLRIALFALEQEK